MGFISASGLGGIVRTNSCYTTLFRAIRSCSLFQGMPPDAVFLHMDYAVFRRKILPPARQLRDTGRRRQTVWLSSLLRSAWRS
nr:MAG TPA: hypothetical protein [Caudoviricetes sp.]